VDKETIMSNDKFALALESLGVVPPTKVSPKTGKTAWAFAKSDEEFKQLLDHEDEQVRWLVEARLTNKTTIKETRTRRMFKTGKRGEIPVYLRYYGAHCVPGEVEVLTRSGWERLDKWGGGEIAQVQEDQSISFLPATRYVGPVVADWVEVAAPYLNSAFTLGHTVPYLKHGSSKWSTLEAGELMERSSLYVPLAGELNYEGTLGPEQLRVLVMAQADGSFEQNTASGRRFTLFLKKERKIARAKQLLEAAGIPFEAQSYPSHPGFVRIIVRQCDYPDWFTPDRKFFGAWLMDTTCAGRRAFVEELRHWDGYSQNGADYYCTTVQANAEWVQTMCHLTGWCAAVNHKPSKGVRQTLYIVGLRTRNRGMVHRKDVSVVTAPKIAYCPRTVTGYWLARHNSNIYITGNTGRWSGGDSANYQNLPRYNPDQPESGALRRALLAPEGNVCVVRDLGQIECLAEDTLVFTLGRGYVKIQDISLHDMLWDGVEWVSHGGAVPTGEKEVVTYDGITGTPDHIVYTASGGKVQLGYAAATGAALAIGERGGEEVRYVGSPAGADPVRGEGRKAVVPVPRAEVFHRAPCAHTRSSEWEDDELRGAPHPEPILPDHTRQGPKRTQRAIQSNTSGHEPEQREQSFCVLPKQGDREQVPLLRGVCSVHVGDFPEENIFRRRGGPNRQRRTLRAGEYPAPNAGGECPEEALQPGSCLSRGSNECEPVRPEVLPEVPLYHSHRDGAERSYPRADNPPPNRGTGGGHVRKAKTYDILNAGPRNRFTANGRIVSNCRVLAHIAGQEDLLDVFRNGGDPYCHMATKLFGYEVTKKQKLERQTGKSVVLGCFTPDTKVLTDAGVKCIVDVMPTDLLWDGEEFVTHAGVIHQGEKECLRAFGVGATQDHEILTEHSWVTWSAVLTSPSLWKSALSRATLPSSTGRTTTTDGTRLSSAHVVGADESTGTTSLVKALSVVGAALGNKVQRHGKNTQGTQTPCQTMHTESAYSTASPALSGGARKSTDTSITPFGESVYTSLGEKIGGRFLSILYLCLDGIKRSWKLTASTTKGITHQETFASPGAKTTPKTGDELANCRSRSSTYDIAFAGPRNRYTVMTECGPILVHNCGYGLGWLKFQDSLRVGFLGAPGVMYGEDAAELLKINIDKVLTDIVYYQLEKMTVEQAALNVRPGYVPVREHLVHCAVVKSIIDLYREANDKIVALWAECDRALNMMARGNPVEIGVGVKLRCADGAIELPNGMRIQYHHLDSKKTYTSKVRGKSVVKSTIYGGRMVENLVQALARIVIGEQWLRIAERYKVVLSTHDEIVIVCPEEEAEEALAFMGDVMATPPSWAPDLPLTSDGGFNRSYGLCEK